MRRLRRLVGRRSYRVRERAYVVEGPVLVRDALETAVGIESVFVGEDYRPELAWLDGAPGEVSVHEVRSGVLETVLGSNQPRPVAAVVVRPGATLQDLIPAEGEPPLVLVLAGVADPGNAGTLLRSAEAAGATGVVFGTGSVDPFGPKTVRASAGALFRVPVCEADAASALRSLREQGIRSILADQTASRAADHVDLAGPTALVLGSEAHGVPSAVLDLVDDRVAVPMRGRIESLNVAMAGTVLAFEAARQRRVRSDRSPER